MVLHHAHRQRDRRVLPRARPEGFLAQLAARLVPHLPRPRPRVSLDAGARRGRRKRSLRPPARLRHRVRRRALRVRHALPRLRRHAPQPHRPRRQTSLHRQTASALAARVARRHARRAARAPAPARPRRTRPPHHAGHRAADRGAPEVPRPRRPRLPRAGAPHRHAQRRRGPAHPPGRAARHQPRRRALRARRAQHRSARARQPPPHRHAPFPARQG